MTTTLIAIDRASVRRIDRDGHLRVDVANISKANVCGYLGREIPGHVELGLEPNRVYHLLRDPEELAKAAESVRGKPVMDDHIPAFSDDHPNDRTVGAIGSDVAFDGEYLKASLTIWPDASIRRIESGEQRELSCGYHYRADMTPGTYKGVAFDGVMRDIQFNHVALVRQGRAGPDVMVGDTRLEISPMLNSRAALVASGAVFSVARPLLAADAKLNLDDAFEGVTRENIAEKRDEIADAVVDIVTPLLAADKALDRDAILGALDAMAAVDDDGDDEITPAKPRKVAKPPKVDDKPIALDADAIRAEVRTSVISEIRELDAAVRAVAPHIGELAIVPDTAEATYKLALDAAIADGRLSAGALTNVPPASFKHMVAALPLPLADRPVIIAQDEADATTSWMKDKGLISSARVRG